MIKNSVYQIAEVSDVEIRKNSNGSCFGCIGDFQVTPTCKTEESLNEIIPSSIVAYNSIVTNPSTNGFIRILDSMIERCRESIEHVGFGHPESGTLLTRYNTLLMCKRVYVFGDVEPFNWDIDWDLVNAEIENTGSCNLDETAIRYSKRAEIMKSDGNSEDIETTAVEEPVSVDD